MSRTTFQKMEEESAIAYMNLPVSKRTAAVDAVEQNYLFNCRAHGLISGEEFQTRSGKKLILVFGRFAIEHRLIAWFSNRCDIKWESVLLSLPSSSRFFGQGNVHQRRQDTLS